MQIYLVGGAVRDSLLGLPIIEKDWVVVGATPQEMIDRGYQPVGKHFPVFLHPHTHEEYALARTERKIAKGYKGFTFHTAPNVTLVEDLKRRDLTINAMAQSPSGELIDPYGGQIDLQNKILRHVSPAFQEDPVRILRVARFSAKLVNFTIHSDTLTLMRNMVAAGEVDELVAERVWQELSRALTQPQPERFFTTLAECTALPLLFPAIKIASTGITTLMRATGLTQSGPVRFAALLSDITPADIIKLFKRYRIPKEYVDLALLVARQHAHFAHVTRTNDAEKILTFILAIDALRRPQRWQNFTTVMQAKDPDHSSTPIDTLNKAIQAMQTIDHKPLQAKNLSGVEFARELKRQRLITIAAVIQS